MAKSPREEFLGDWQFKRSKSDTAREPGTADDKKIKLEMLSKLSSELNAAQVQLIGRVGVLYRPAEKPGIVLP